MTDASPDPPAPDAGWIRLHPLTPIARVGRLAPALVLLLVVSNVHSKAENGTAETDYLIAITLHLRHLRLHPLDGHPLAPRGRHAAH